MLKFGDKTVKSKEFYTNATPLNIEDVKIENLVLSDSIPANKGKDDRFVIGYQDQDGKLSPLLIKTPKKIYSQGVSQYSEGSAFTMSFDLGDYPEWLGKYEEMLKTVESLEGHCLTNISVKKDRYINPKLKEWEGELKPIFIRKKYRREVVSVQPS